MASDGAGWCKSTSLGVVTTAGSATRRLDRFHVNREIRRAFGGKAYKATRFISLAYRKKARKMTRGLRLVTDHAMGKDKVRYVGLQGYLTNSLELTKGGSRPFHGVPRRHERPCLCRKDESLGRGLVREGGRRLWQPSGHALPQEKSSLLPLPTTCSTMTMRSQGAYAMKSPCCLGSGACYAQDFPMRYSIV